MSWLKFVAPMNMASIVVNLEVSHKRDVLVKRRCPKKHLCDSGGIPRSNRSVEGNCIVKHVLRILHLRRIPHRKILVEAACIGKHCLHCGAIGNVPRTDVLVKVAQPIEYVTKIFNVGHTHLPMGHPYVQANSSASSRLYWQYFFTASRSSWLLSKSLVRLLLMTCVQDILHSRHTILFRTNVGVSKKAKISTGICSGNLFHGNDRWMIHSMSLAMC
jgi:hypothetical protein